jgi:hypothetical protein
VAKEESLMRFSLDLPETFRFCCVRQSVEFDVTLHRHVPTQVRELHLDQLLWVERAMPVPE